MITFKNITGNKFLAVGTIQRKSALNGEKSLTGTLYDGDDVLNKIDKGWSLEFDNEPYIVTYFERNDNDNSVSFDAIHKFFWNMAKNVLYSETSGSHTIKWYLDQIFADAGYTYALNFNPNAIAKDNWGMKNKLSLFNDIITSIEGEFEINGTLVSIFKNIGTDLSTIVRYGFNLSDMTIENDASGFVTYGEGFGAYADQENMTGDRLHVTYTSPLASVYGKLQAEPIDDQRYTIESNLLDAVKSQVDASFSISVNLSLYDLSVAGYPYKMANVGDWLTAVDENLDFKQRIRIISIDDAFAADGTRISYSVTAGDIGLTKKYQDANASIANKVEDAVISAGQAATDANIALIAANGKNKSYHLNDINDLPKTANEGDLAWVQSGDGRVLYIYTKKADGTYYWEKRIDPEMGEQIEAGVNEAIAQANENTATSIEQNNIAQQEVMNDIAKSQADLAIKDGDFNNKAQAMADKALSDAKANTATVAKSTLDTANQNIADAKKSVTDDIAQEASNRASAVSALDTKAQGYADTAKKNAIDVATSADGVINKKIDDTASSITSTVSQNKKDAEGKITTAQSTATQALNGLSSKVDTSTYNAKTGQLSTDVTNVTQTANQAKTDIASIKQTDTTQDARMTTIESDASGTKTTVSDIQIEQGKQSGSISILQQRADGFDASVAKINNVVNSLGQTNQLFNTEFSPDFEGWYEVDNGYELSSQVPTYDGSNVVHIKTANTDYDWLRQKIPVVPGQVLSFSTMMKFAPTSPDDSTVYWRYSINFYKSSGGSSLAITYGKQNFQALDWTLQKSENIVAPADAAYVTINYYMRGAGEAWLAKPMLVFESTVGQYVQGNYNNNDALAKVKLTAEQAALDLSNYKTDADGRISKAQTDIVATAKDVTTKVSQIDYNAKTGDLSTSVSKAQQTADSAVTTIGNYKTSNDNRVKATETSIAQNTKDITLRATTSDLNSAKADYNAQIAQVNVNANAITSQVSSIQTKINSMGQVNQLANTEFNPDMSGWFSKSGYPSISQSNGDVSSKITPLYGSGVSDSNAVKIDTSKDSASTYTLFRQVVRVTPGSVFSLSWAARTEQSNQYSNLWIRFQNEASTATVSEILVGDWSKDKDGSGSVSSTWRRITNKKATNIMVPDNATYVLISFESREGMIQYLSQPMLVFGSTVGDYVPGAYNSNDKVAVQQVTIDGITNTVTQQGKDINSVTSRVQTAEGTLSTATDNISGLQSKQTQTANQLKQEVTDRTTGDSNTLQSSKDFTQSTITGYDSGLQSQLTQTNDAFLATVSANNLVVDSSLMDSAYSNSIVNWNVTRGNGWYYSSGVAYKGVQSMGYNQNSLDGDYSYLDSLSWSNFSFTGTTLNVSVDVKVNTIGSAETDYLIVYLIEADADMKTVAQTSITGTLRDSNSSWTNYRKRITVNSASKNFYLRYQMRGNGNVYVARPYVGVQELVEGGYTAGTNNNNQTILSLFKDNWSIGISDNIGNITSGIVGNSNSMSLISKNVIIDSPSTQITGTAWIKTAMIANGAIGSAQIGDATITSAKIATLDVAKLTGNVSNFIQSNWNGLYGSTYITSDGMTVSSGSTTTSFGSQGMRITMASSGGVVIQGANKSNGTQTGVLIGMNVGSTFTSFGFQSSSNYLYNDEMVILKTGSQAAGDYNIGGGVAFNHNVSFMDNIYMKYGKGFYGKWGDPQQAIFFQTINSGIPAIMHISGAGIAFGHKGDLYMLSHGGWQDFNNSSIKGSYTVDQPWITG